MRLTGWAAGLALIACVAAGGTLFVYSHVGFHAPVTAAQVMTVAANAPGIDPPHVIPQRPSSPSPSARPSTPPVAPARAASRPSLVVRSTQQALINGDRAAHGLPPLTWSSCLYSVAVANAKRIAAQGYLSHTNGPQLDLTCGLGNRAGENIGDWSAGVNDAQLNSMFMASPEHRANILGPYHYVATAWIVAKGVGYIAVEFG
jgi:uncharacterized protein YkwD